MSTGSPVPAAATTPPVGSRLPQAVEAGLGPISSPPWPGNGGGVALAFGIPALTAGALLRRRPASHPQSALDRNGARPTRRCAAIRRPSSDRRRTTALAMATLFAVAPIAGSGITSLHLSQSVRSGTVPVGPPVRSTLSAFSGVAQPDRGAPGTAPGQASSSVPVGAAAGMRPERISIPALGVDTSILPESVGTTGALGVPRDPTTVGWWAAGPLPGATAGTAVLDSHINYGGTPGAFAHLGQLVPGDVLTLIGAGGPQRFTVTGTREYAKVALPWASIFSGQVQGRLALVTCGGAFDAATGHYADNVVAFAVPLT